MILKLKRTPGIYLVGFMGCGKTVVGTQLAQRLGWTFCDIDADIVSSEKVSIAEIFDTRGEEEFRRLETAAIADRVRMVQSGTPLVVALGGGAFVQRRNFEILENNGVTLWLDCPLAMIRRRLASSTDRPLARDPHKFEILYYARRESYALADHRIEVSSDNPADTIDAILRLPLF